MDGYRSNRMLAVSWDLSEESNNTYKGEIKNDEITLLIRSSASELTLKVM